MAYWLPFKRPPVYPLYSGRNTNHEDPMTGLLKKAGCETLFMTGNTLYLTPGRLAGTCLTLVLAFIIGGCQEDFGQSKAASASAATASEKRLNDAVSSFEKTLGQQTSDQGSAMQVADRPSLRWQRPATREDGSPLLSGDILEYRIYYRLRHQSGFKAITFPASAGTTFKLSEFKSGAYEFSVTAVDTDGRESQRSQGVIVDLI